MNNSDCIQFPGVVQFFLEIPIYKTFNITKSNEYNVFEIQYTTIKLDTHCLTCNKLSVFHRVETAKLPNESLIFQAIKDKTTKQLDGALGDYNYRTSKKYFDVIFSCARDCGQDLRFCFQVNKEQLEKIGQYPSLADLHISKIQKYRRLLGKQYNELTKAIGLNSHGIGVGSFVYLRRIFENLIAEAFEGAKYSLSVTDEDFYRLRMDEKISTLNSFLPSFLVENRNVYGILSKGIHSLDEDECKEFFHPVLSVIEIILDEKLAKIEKQEKENLARKQLQEITQKLAKN